MAKVELTVKTIEVLVQVETLASTTVAVALPPMPLNLTQPVPAPPEQLAWLPSEAVPKFVPEIVIWCPLLPPSVSVPSVSFVKEVAFGAPPPVVSDATTPLAE